MCSLDGLTHVGHHNNGAGVWDKIMCFQPTCPQQNLLQPQLHSTLMNHFTTGVSCTEPATEAAVGLPALAASQTYQT